MTYKLGRIIYFILIICTFLWNQQTVFLTQKIAVENSYRDKVVSAVSRLLGQENFIVIVNVELATVGEPLKKMDVTQSRQGTASGYTPIPGLPIISPQSDSSPSTLQESERMGKNNFSINKV